MTPSFRTRRSSDLVRRVRHRVRAASGGGRRWRRGRAWRGPAAAARAGLTRSAVPVRYALGVEYDGTGLFGWQRLGKPGTRAVPTVQQMLEEALSSVADAPVDTVCAGRTDAGVHARCQVVHFDSDEIGRAHV